jgi:hypothetical protein
MMKFYDFVPRFHDILCFVIRCDEARSVACLETLVQHVFNGFTIWLSCVVSVVGVQLFRHRIIDITGTSTFCAG